MIRRHLPLLCSLLVSLALALGVVRDARAAAAPNDEEVEVLVQTMLEGEYREKKFKEALEKLDLGKQACQTKSSCSPKVRAKLYVAIGTVLAEGMKKPAEAKEAFGTALKEDPTVTLFSDYITPDVEKSFNDARGGASPSGGNKETQAAETREPKKVYKGGAAPRGWRSGEAYFYYNEASSSEKQREWMDCVAYGQASLAAENRPSTRYLVALCEERGGLWLEALADYQTVSDTAGKFGLRTLGYQALKHAEELRKKIPKLILRKPAKAEGLKVKLNGVDIDEDKLGGEIWVNPGSREVVATGKVNGAEMFFEQTVDVGEFETTSVDIKLEPKGAKGVDRAVFKCMAEAKTQAEFDKCASSKRGLGSLNLHLGLETSGYHDSDHTDVLTPGFFFNIESPTGGWGVGGSLLVDVVTTASSDIVATASPRWTEQRYVPALAGHKKFGDVDVNLHGAVSREPDYLATSVGTLVSIDLRQKTITPSFGYDFSYDISGRSGTSYDVFSRKIIRNALTGAVTFVLDKSSILSTSFNAVLESGDTSKPYRYIPMFPKDIAKRVLPGQTISVVNRYRNPERVLEQLPTNRQRFALSALYAHRFSSSTLRIDERLYADSWALKATTTDLKLLIDVTKDLRIWPHGRVHAQTGVSFWQLAYISDQTPTGLQVPALRTGDRELGPLLGLTGGLGARLGLGSWALTFTGDVIYTRFFDTLYILQRIGYFGSLTAEVDIQ